MNRTRDLLHLYFDDRLDEAGLSDLDALLASDPEARRLFVAMSRELGLLSETLRGDADLLMRGNEERPAPPRPERPAGPSLTATRRRIAAVRARPASPASWTRALPWAAAALLALGAAWLLAGTPRRPAPAPGPAPDLAREETPPDDSARIVKSAAPQAPTPASPGGAKRPEPPTPAVTPTTVDAPGPDPIPPDPAQPAPADRPAVATGDRPPGPGAHAPEVRPTTVAGGLAAAVLERVQGAVTVVSAAGPRPAQAGLRIQAGEAVRTKADGRAALELADGTMLEMDGETELRDTPAGGVQRSVITVDSGTVRADVRPQRSDRPLLFRTPHAEALVLGTRLALIVGPASTRLEVRQGRVRLTRLPDGKSVEVAAGQFAEAAPEAALQSGKLLTIVSFQDGVSPTAAYAGTRDTTISREGEPTDAGTLKACRVAGRPASGVIREACALLRWDLSEIPSGSTVVSAALALHVETPSTRQAFDVVELKRPWNEVEATWTSATQLLPWGRRGAQDETDRGAAVLATAPTDAREGPVSIMFAPAGVAVVQRWVHQPGTNLGMMLVNPRKSAGLSFASRESETPTRRPRFIVVFTPPDGPGR